MRQWKPGLFNFALVGKKEDFENKLQYLASIAMPEKWDYINNPSGCFPILKNYIFHTFDKAQSENKIMQQWNVSAFNTWLVTEKQEEIFMFFEKNWFNGEGWYFKSFCKESDVRMCCFVELPQRVNYFSDPAELIYDPKIRLAINYQHIIEDNLERFPEEIRTTPMLAPLLQSAIEMAKKRVARNYKTAIPQYYEGKIQLLLPICLRTPEKADLALVIWKIQEEGAGIVYRASTCLTLDMALNNARLLCKPDNEWLNP